MKLNVPFIQLPITFDANALLEEIHSIEEVAWRGRTDRDDGNTALTLITAGGDPDNDDLSGQMQPTPWLERMPYTRQVLSALGATWGRARLMRLNGQAEVRAHVDVNYYWRERMRVHVPVVTTPSVRFQCGDEETHMAAGECWIFDTWRRHRVVNNGQEQRIHLVADTVGGDGLWDLLVRGRSPGRQLPRPWQPAFVGRSPGAASALDFETINAPVVMSPWEMRDNIQFLLGECVGDPRVRRIEQILLRLIRRWQAAWAAHGVGQGGWPSYRAILADARHTLLGAQVDQIGLFNEVGLWQGLCSHVLDVALGYEAGGSGERQQDRHGQGSAHDGGVVVPDPEAASRQGVFDRPVFILSAPRSGSTLLFETLSQARDVYTIGDESHQLIEGIVGLAPAQRDYDSNALSHADASPQVVAQLRQRFWSALRDREGVAVQAGAVRMLEKTPKNALRISFLREAFPDGRFVFLYRDARETIGSMIDAWNSGHFTMYRSLPGWPSQMPWSLLLVPGWRELAGQPLHEVVAAQWQITMEHIMDALEAMPEDRWVGVDYAAFMADPQRESLRICDMMGIDWDRTLEATLPASRYTLTAPAPEKWRKHAHLIEPLLPALQSTIRRAEALLARHKG